MTAYFCLKTIVNDILVDLLVDSKLILKSVFPEPFSLENRLADPQKPQRTEHFYFVEVKEVDAYEIGLVFEITGGTLYTFVTENVSKTALDRWLVLVHLTHSGSLFLLVSPNCKDSVLSDPIVCLLCTHIS
jgi:hypothetical protein